MKRTHTCGALRAKDAGQAVVLQGWVHKTRDHGGLVFVDIRDRYGFTQVVFDPDHSKDAHTLANTLRREYVVEVSGKVRPRPQNMINTKLDTGETEVLVDTLTVLSEAKTPPIEVDDRKTASDEMRLKYRYLDLRRPLMQQHLLTRHKATSAIHAYMNAKGFLEVETPIFMKSTPEGARDYVVPSRVNPGQFYALPQSPQIYKQILMVSGCDRYYQMARCFRDEDLRADRQPEFTQMDMEMSFVEQNDVHEMIEGLIQAVMKETLGVDVPVPFQKLSYDDAIARFGTDAPDLRFGMELIDLADAIQGCEFQVFNDVIKGGGLVKAIVASGLREEDFSRKRIEGKWTDHIKQYGAKGLAWFKVEHGALTSSIAKFFNTGVQNQILSATQAEDGDFIFMIADKPAVVAKALGHFRVDLAKHLNLLDPKVFKYCWVVEFPLFEKDEETNQWTPAHHMFCMPTEEGLTHLDSDPGKVKCTQYDLILNGTELGSGSIRIHRADIQEKVMKIIGLSKEQMEQKFGFMLEAFTYGAPPHGGIGIGFDRLVALICGFQDIREVIAFPKNKAAQCPMDGCPSPVEQKALDELSIKLNLGKHVVGKREEQKEAAPSHTSPTEEVAEELGIDKIKFS